jgi:CHAT domain-containing protein
MDLFQKLREIDHSSVAQIIPMYSAVVEFIRFNLFDFKAVTARGESEWCPAHYLAVVLRGSDPADVQIFDLGEADLIDSMVAQFRSHITHEADYGGSRGLGALADEQDELEAQTLHGLNLQYQVFKPLKRTLQGCRHLIFAPDGDLTRLPFEILPTGDNRYLIDDFEISYLSTVRDLLRFGLKRTFQPNESILIADPDFNLGSDMVDEGQIAKGTHSRALMSSIGPAKQLPATRTEGKRIGDMLQIRPWFEGDALEARVKSCRSPRILHLATHGFFLADQQRNLNRNSRGLGAVGWQSGFAADSLLESNIENPLLRSGLVLAGFNTWLKGENPPEEAEDGILTAEDVTGLNLLATDLVVLSACETGLGEIRTGEGVFGLRRAFILAGAKTLVMSLWGVPDQETQELMEEFYRRVLAGQSRAGALREAQLMIREKHPDPFFWGAFICQGDPSPMDS